MKENNKRTRMGLLPRKRAMLRAARSRASKRGLPFNLTVEDFQIPERCPALGIEITLDGDRDSSPSLDRVVPPMGYVRGNVIVLSTRANRIKNDATAHELKSIAEFLENLISKEWMKS